MYVLLYTYMIRTYVQILSCAYYKKEHAPEIWNENSLSPRDVAKHNMVLSIKTNYSVLGKMFTVFSAQSGRKFLE